MRSQAATWGLTLTPTPMGTTHKSAMTFMSHASIQGIEVSCKMIGEHFGVGAGVGFETFSDGGGEGGIREGAAEGAVEDLAARLGEAAAGLDVFPEFQVEALHGAGVFDVFGRRDGA